ncbi:cysteine desulfurase family protein [Micrococcus luteus]
MILLDHAATAPVRREAVEAMWPYLTGDFGNPSSVHELGRRAGQALEAARGQVADVLGARPSEVVFTSGGTEADVLALQGIVLPKLLRARRRGTLDSPLRLVTTAIEHGAVRQTATSLRRVHGIEVDLLPVDGTGRVDPEDLCRVLRPETALVSVHLGNNEIGTVQPIAELAAVAHEAGVPIHTDAVQAAGQLDLDVAALGVDALSVSGHKVGSPKGIGALWIRPRLPLEPVLTGGGQEAGRRSGTQNVAGAVAMGAAMTMAEAERTDPGEAGAAARAARRDRFIARVLDGVDGVRLSGHPEHRLPQHASFLIEGVTGEAVLVELEARGVLCSVASACSAGLAGPSPVLAALGLDSEAAQSSLRCTFGPHTTEAELDQAAAAVIAGVQAVRRLG